MKSLIREEMDKKIIIRSGGIEKKITKREGIVVRLFEKALKGDDRISKLLLSIDDQFDLVSEFANDDVTRPDDQQVLDQQILDEFERAIREAADTQSRTSNKKRRHRT